ncbi:hypothetical protein AGMMS4956_19210 [Bacteroidia bacterium]|nr:hypothetical protein AGMMS4956_19210 [Bacteroidia bacterium]
MAAFTFISVKLVLEKAFEPIEVTLLGMVTDAKLLQSEKAPEPIVVTLLGMVTDAKLQQP